MIIGMEGVDGVGKTTQCTQLKHYIERHGGQAVIVKELNSTELGKLTRTFLTGEVSRTVTTQLFMFLACMSELWTHVIRPLEKSGKVVICDRGIGSFVTYFMSHGMAREDLMQLALSATQGGEPHYTFLIELPAEEVKHRIEQKEALSAFDKMSADFFQRQAQAFETLAERERWHRIDGRNDIAEIHRQVVTFLDF